MIIRKHIWVLIILVFPTNLLASDCEKELLGAYEKYRGFILSQSPNYEEIYNYVDSETVRQFRLVDSDRSRKTIYTRERNIKRLVRYVGSCEGNTGRLLIEIEDEDPKYIFYFTQFTFRNDKWLLNTLSKNSDAGKHIMLDLVGGDGKFTEMQRR